MNAATAKKNSKDWLAQAQRENKDYNRERIAREKRESSALWKTRGVEWVKQIDVDIERASKQGQHHTFLPSHINPDGDLVIWLPESDRPIHQLLMKHYRDKGFNVKEYSPIALAITW